MAATSLRGGVAALTAKLRRRPPAPESILKIVASLGKLKGVAMKMGQHLSYVDSSISHEVRAALSALQTHSQATPIEHVIATIREELGAAAAVLIDSLEAQPIASASIGQVHRACLPDGTQVAVKVQHPGIVDAIKSDFGPASVAGRLATWLYPAKQIEGFVREARAQVLDECDYRAEARHQTELATWFAGHASIAIPAVHGAYSAGRVLVTSFASGQHFGELLATGPSQAARDRLGQALFDFYIGSFLRWGVLSADPHPGNYVFCADGRIAIVDHGCTRSFHTASPLALASMRVLAGEDRATVYRMSTALGGDALMPLRLRFGLASVLTELGARTSWGEMIRRCAAWSEATPALLKSALDPLPASGSSPSTSPSRAVAFEVVLLDRGTRMIEMVREVRDATGAGVREAKDIVERTPQVVKRTVDRGEAEALKRRLEVSGGVVEIRTATID